MQHLQEFVNLQLANTETTCWALLSAVWTMPLLHSLSLLQSLAMPHGMASGVKLVSTCRSSQLEAFQTLAGEKLSNGLASCRA